MTVEAHLTGVEKFQVEVQVGSARIIADASVSAGGTGLGPTPHELLAAALATCTTMTVKMYAERKGWPLADIHVSVRHGHDESGTKDRFAVKIVLEGALDNDQRRRLLEIASHCPVRLTLERGSEVIDQS